MDATIQEKASLWLDARYDEDTRKAVQHLMDQDPKGLEDAFYTDLEFGTGGLRGVMGPGTNRMNIYTVSNATQGLANYIKAQGIEGRMAVAISYDCRKNSDVFARRAAEVLSANGIEVYLVNELRPTPVLSFAVRHYGCTAGIMITASHNPPEYNGYKVYWSDGAQIVPPHDKGIISEVRKVTGPEQVAQGHREEIIHPIGPELDTAYQDAIFEQCIHLDAVERQCEMPIVFTNLHGTAITHVPRFLQKMGFINIHSVSSQEVPDGNFPTVVSPNPEEREALTEALKLGQEVNAEIIIATDPDCDRVGIAVPNPDGELELLNGNQTATVLTYYLLDEHLKNDSLPDNAYVCSTIVTTELMDRIAEHYGVPCYVTLTGFKWIADVIRRKEGSETFVGGGEESYGFMIGDAVRDKDAVVTAGMLCEVAAFAKEQGKTFYEYMVDMYVKFGMYREALVSLVKKGKDGAAEIRAIMDGYRNNTPSVLAGSEVIEVRDYQTGLIRNLKTGATQPTGIPASNVIQFYLADGSKVTARPSGTEPKIKFYFSLKTELRGASDYAAAVEGLEKRIAELKEAFVNG